MGKAVKTRILHLILFSLLALAGLFVIYLIFNSTGFGIPCIFFKITGIKCAGCGNTRAVQSLLNFNLRASLSYNYLYPLELFYILWVYLNSAIRYIKEGKFNYKPPCQAFDIILLIIIILWIPLRNILGV